MFIALSDTIIPLRGVSASLGCALETWEAQLNNLSARASFLETVIPLVWDGAWLRVFLELSPTASHMQPGLRTIT